MKVTSLACIQGAWLPDFHPQRILDIGAGTGLLTLMAAQKHDGYIDAVEIQPDAYQQLVSNTSESPWHRRITCHLADIRDFAKDNSTTYDLIITNPPFFQNQLQSEDPKINQARHSTDLVVDELLAVVSKLLKSDGIASILLPLVETRNMINQSRLWSLNAIKQLIIHDQPQKPPRAIVTYLSKIPEKPVRQVLSIKNSQNDWSDKYIALLRPYYLNI